MPKNKKTKNIKLVTNPFYTPYIQDYSHRFECYKGSAGSGKSYFITQKLIIKAIQSSRKILMIRKIGTTIRDSIWQTTLDIIEEMEYSDFVKVNKSDFTIRFTNSDSTFIFKGLDDPEKIKSISGITDIFCEEATELTLDDVTQLNLRLRTRRKYPQMFFAFNPVSKTNWVYNYFGFTPENQLQETREYDDTIVFSTNYTHNKMLTKEYIDTLQALKDTNPIYYKIYVQGIFATLDKLVYNNWSVKDFDYKEILKKPDTIAIFGLDFGYINDESAFIASIVDTKNNIIYVFDEFYQKGLLNNEIADMIKSKGYSKEIIIADSAERKSIEELRQFGILRIKPARKGHNSIMQGIQKIQQYKIFVHINCQNTISELQNYSYKKDKQTGEYVNQPVDSNNHLMDAIRYSIQALNTHKPRVLNFRF